MAHADSYAGLDIQELGFMIHNGPDFVELIALRKEFAQWAVIGILLEGSGPFVIEVIGDPRCWNEFKVSKSARVVRIDNRIEDNVHWVQVQSNDGPNLGSNAPRFPIIVINAELELTP